MEGGKEKLLVEGFQGMVKGDLLLFSSPVATTRRGPTPPEAERKYRRSRTPTARHRCDGPQKQPPKKLKCCAQFAPVVDGVSVSRDNQNSFCNTVLKYFVQKKNGSNISGQVLHCTRTK